MVNNLIVEKAALSTLKTYSNNPKMHNNKQIQQIAESIKKFKFNNPILIDEKNEIIAGHGRLFAAEHLGLKEVPVARNFIWLKISRCRRS
ncbi:MAG: ParB/Srx family N-terminal domain-containing protein [Candidatus Gastranaerophilales bacterium]|nr:ParB/Srx family N-terminal domain-containing protein [Candidatus Gastranaerophilales bacterium]